jgi:hypothetical protein
MSDLLSDLLRPPTPLPEEGEVRVEGHHSVSAYFHDVLSEALRNQGVMASAYAEFYLVNLLSEYSHAPISDQPLPVLLMEANQSPPSQRSRKLREIGDHALYVTGFFADSLERRHIDIDYYIMLGGNAYRWLRAHTAPPWSDTYAELAQKFRQLVQVLAEVAERTPLRNNLDLLQLYERYVRTGSRLAAQRLRRFGLAVVPQRVQDSDRD